MCGISGCIVDKKLSPLVIDKTLSLMKNRGPDNQSYKVYNFGKKILYLLVKQ